ncbi:GCN5-related N-acetyltransferase [Calothrix sp. NIES-4101]|nr:GCN5-related N-acetyltransferase [Calothrix sp. NIES-4101]
MGCGIRALFVGFLDGLGWGGETEKRDVFKLFTMKVITIRSYKPSDLESVVQLWYKTWHQTFPHLQHPQAYSVWKERFSHEFVRDGEIFLAEVEKQIVGFIVLIKDKQVLSQLFIDEKYQRQGIGTKLLNRAKALSPQGLKLDALRENIKARAFYERHGFKIAGFSINEFNGQPNVEYYWTPENAVSH